VQFFRATRRFLSFCVTALSVAAAAAAAVVWVKNYPLGASLNTKKVGQPGGEEMFVTVRGKAESQAVGT